ncbi:MAG: hypothetical protein UH788_04305 [Treponemataceae bacterium]|nr:hypothetical protein [Treponemataceae bacterium]
MSSAKKACISLLITILIFAIFAVLFFSRLFGSFETKFYQPAVIAGLEKHLKEVSACLDEYTMNQATKFQSFVNLPCVKNASSATQTEKDINDRDYYAKGIIDLYSGLQGIRIIDSQGKKIFYSSYKTDSSNYTESLELPYENIKSNKEIENRNKSKIVFDNSKERIIYSFPFYDNYDIYRGSVIFYVAGSDFNHYLISKNILSLSEKATLVATVFSDSIEQSKGFVLGLPSVSSEAIISKIVELWSKDSFSTQKILHSEDYNWFVISDNSGKTGIISLVFKDDILFFSPELQVLLLLCAFITLYLVILFFFNIKQDDQAIIKDKIKKFKIALINEYLENTDDVNWDEVSKFLAVRKHQINHDIKYYLGKKAETHKVLVDNLLEKTWNDVENIILNHEKVDNYEELKNQNSNNSDNIEEFECLQEMANSTETYQSSEQVETLECISEVSDDVEEVEYLDSSDYSFNEWGDDESYETNQKIENSVTTFRFNKDNTSSVADFNFEFSRPDFGELDNELEEEFNKIDEEIDEIEELEVFSEDDEFVSEIEEISENEIDEVEELSVTEEEIEILDEVSEEIIETNKIEEVQQLANKTENLGENKIQQVQSESIVEVPEDIITVEKISSLAEQNSYENEIPEAELEELNYVEIFSLTSGLNAKFFTSEEIEELYPVDEENPIMETESGIFVISNNIDTKNLCLDQNFQNLVDSVLQNTI